MPRSGLTLRQGSRLALFLCLLLASAAHGLDLTGVWKMCYEPGLEDVDEPSEGYLVFLPGQRYFELRDDCCREQGEPVSRELGRYRVDRDSVHLEKTRLDGQRYDVRSEQRLELVDRATVVLFDDLYGEAIDAPVLKVGRSLNYGFAKVYPRPEPLEHRQP